MTAITFDTLEFVRTLQEAGFDERQAEGISSAFKDTWGEANLATKGDLRDMEQRMETRFARIGGETNLLRWMLAALLAINSAALVKLLFE